MEEAKIYENVTVETVDEEAENRREKTGKLYNIITLAYGGFILFAQIFLLLSMFLGIIYVYGVKVNFSGISKLITEFKLMFGESIFKAIFIGIYGVFQLIVAITVLVGTIKACKAFRKLVNLNDGYAERVLKFEQLARLVTKSYGIALILIACSLFTGNNLTGMAVGVLVLCSIMYVCNFTLITTFNELQKDKFDWLAFALEICKKLTLFLIACIVYANIRECITVLVDSVVKGEFVKFDSGIKNFCVTYFGKMRPPILIFPYFIAAVITVNIETSLFNNPKIRNAKSNGNVGLKQSFVTLLAFVVALCILDCLMCFLYGMTFGEVLKYISQNWFGLLFASIAGIIITRQDAENKKLK